MGSNWSWPVSWRHSKTRTCTCTGAVPLLVNHSASAFCRGVSCNEVGATCRLAAVALPISSHSQPRAAHPNRPGRRPAEIGMADLNR